MRSFTLLLLLFSIQLVLGEDFETFVDPADIITDRGYPVEKYTVQTEDGYLLGLYRIPHGINGTGTNPRVVLLNHGLGSSAGDYLSLNAKRSIGYILADNGYDVWLMNARGNSYSQKHISIDVSDTKTFYNFSWHQVGFYDIPANIDFILNKTNQEKLQYIGHSQGGTSFLVMASSRPEYNAKISLAQLLAPAAIMKNVDPLIYLLIPFYDFLMALPDKLNIHHLPFAGLIRSALQLICKQDKYFENCANLYDLVVGYANHDEIDKEVFPNIFRTAFSTFALKQPLHYLQIIRAGSFQQLDYGSDINLALYNSTIPPDYELDKITAPVAIYTGENDHCVGEKDAEELSNILPNVVKFKVNYIKDNGYPAEEHIVQTEDGYLLSVYRIPYGINGTSVNKKPVLLNHGLLESSGGFLILGPQRSLGFILADHGYDVWLMNARGTTYSNKHISIDERTNKSAFYNFSWHEIGFYDIPACIDYILNKTSQKQLYYVGHSQGTTSFFAMASTRLEYNKKIKFTVLLSPTAVIKRIRKFFKTIAPYFDRFAAFLNKLQIYDMIELTEFLKFVGNLCQYRVFRPFCQYPYDFLGGYANPDQMDHDMYPKIACTSPSNVAIKQLVHYFQLVRKEKFCQIDYGTEKNLQIYGTSEPPDYRLDLITTPVAIYLGKNDHFSVPADAEILKDILPNVKLFKLVPHDGWNHLNFVFGLDVVKLLYNDMIQLMSKY